MTQFTKASPIQGFGMIRTLHWISVQSKMAQLPENLASTILKIANQYHESETKFLSLLKQQSENTQENLEKIFQQTNHRTISNLYDFLIFSEIEERSTEGVEEIIETLEYLSKLYSIPYIQPMLQLCKESPDQVVEIALALREMMNSTLAWILPNQEISQEMMMAEIAPFTKNEWTSYLPSIVGYMGLEVGIPAILSNEMTPNYLHLAPIHIGETFKGYTGKSYGITQQNLEIVSNFLLGLLEKIPMMVENQMRELRESIENKS